MPRPPRLDFRGAVHHVIVRGNERRNLFRDDGDRRDYLGLLGECRQKFDLATLAYCLMSNHVHLALQTGAHRLDRAMHFMLSTYAQKFNRRYGREGHLFQGRYKALLVQNDAYLLALIRYIHENPVKAGLTAQPERYRWSSDRQYREKTEEHCLDTVPVLSQFASDPRLARRAYVRFMAREDGISYEDIPLSAGVVKGDEQFAIARLAKLEEPDLPLSFSSVERVAAAVAAAEGVSVQELRGRVRSAMLGRARATAALLGRQWASISLAETARFLGRESSTVVKMAGRLEAEMRESEPLRARFEAIRRVLAGPADKP